MRVLFLSTPFDGRSHLDGSRLAVRDLAIALAARSIEPSVLVAPGVGAPPGARGIEAKSPRDAALAAALAKVDVVHAWFSPRLATSAVLRLVRALRRRPIVQTVPSIPGRWAAVRHALAGDVVVPTSDATAIALATRGVDAVRMTRVPSPFSFEAPAKAADAPRDLVLYAGDWEFDAGVDRALAAFAQVSAPRGVVPHLAIAARGKTPRAKEVEARVRRRVETSAALRGRVSILGELPSLLPWIAAARVVILPATTTFAKLDHPRVLLEALACGVRIVVGPAPPLAALVDDARLGEVARDVPGLREAIERAFEAPPPPPEAIAKLLLPRSPDAVAERYASLYRKLVTARPR